MKKISLCFIPIIVLICVIWHYGVNVVYMDEFRPLEDFLKMLESNAFDFKSLAVLHNEHRIIFPLMLTHILAYFSHYNTKVLMMCSVFLLSVGYLIFARSVVNKKLKQINWLDVLCITIIGFCLLSFCQAENLLWGFQIAWYLIEFCIIAGIVTLVKFIKTNRLIWGILTIICGTVASFSSLHGLAVWPCYAVILVLWQIEERKFNFYPLLLIVISAIIVMLLYFNGYHEIPYHRGAKASSIPQVIEYFFINVGNVLSPSRTPKSCFIAGLLEVILSTILFLTLLIQGKIREQIIPLGIIVYCFGYALMLGIGRAGWGVVPRYMTLPLLAVAGNIAISYYIAVTQKNIQQIFAIICGITLAVCCLYNSYYSLRYYPQIQKYRTIAARVMLDYRNQPLNNLRILLPFKDMAEVNYMLGRANKYNLSVFYEMRNQAK